MYSKNLKNKNIVKTFRKGLRNRLKNTGKIDNRSNLQYKREKNEIFSGLHKKKFQTWLYQIFKIKNNLTRHIHAEKKGN